MNDPRMPSLTRTNDGARRLALGVLVVVWGMQALVTQSLLVREALVLMFGGEFAWGVVLCAWLLGVAAGAALGGHITETRFGRRHALGALLVNLLLLMLLSCLALWIFRGARAWMGVGAGELPSLAKSAWAALLLVMPAGAPVGLAFPLACGIGQEQARLRRDNEIMEISGGPDARPARIEEGGGDRLPGCIQNDCRDVHPARPDRPQARARRQGGTGVLSFGHVYALESFGSLAGGAIFSFWAVERLAPIQTILLCGALTAAAGVGVLATRERGVETATNRDKALRLAGAALLTTVTLLAASLALFRGAELNRRLVALRWNQIAPGFELVAETESKYQNLALGRRMRQYSVYCDGRPVADFPDPYGAAPRAHLWMCQHPEPRNVLLIGGGAEGLLAEMLHHPVERIDYVETDARLLALIEPYLEAADLAALRDARVAIHHADARYYVKTNTRRFDLVIARLPEPLSALQARYYTIEFFAELRRAMTEEAVLCLTATAAPGELSPLTREYLGTLRAALRTAFAEVVVGWGTPAQVFAAARPGLISLDARELAARYERRGIVSSFFHPAWFDGAVDWLDPAKIARRAADLDLFTSDRLGADLQPTAYLQRLALWEEQNRRRTEPRASERAARAGASPGLIQRLRSIRLTTLIALLATAGALMPLYARKRHGPRCGWSRGAVVLSVATTGFVTMALSIIWLYAFQNLYGYVYQRIGWIIALFMAGLTVGCLAGQRFSRRRETTCRRGLIGIDVLLSALALSLPFALTTLGNLTSAPRSFAVVEGCLSLLVILTGLLGGAAFALAARLETLAAGRAGAAAGSVVGADHLGACLGALLCGIVLVPVFGTLTAAWLLVGMKLVSAGLLIATGPTCREQPGGAGSMDSSGHSVVT